MTGGSYYWIIIHVKYPIWRVCALPEKNIGIDHCSGGSVIAKRLYLQPIITKEMIAFRPLIDFIRVYIKSAVRENVAKTEVVTSHCWMMAQVERRSVSGSKSFRNEAPSFFIVKQESLESLLVERFPAVKTLLDILGYLIPVMPKLHNNFGYVSSAIRFLNWHSFLNEFSNVARAQPVILGNPEGVMKGMHYLLHGDRSNSRPKLSNLHFRFTICAGSVCYSYLPLLLR
jgi:hypothetical protein